MSPTKGLVVFVAPVDGPSTAARVQLEAAGWAVECCQPFDAVRFAWQRPIDLAVLDLAMAEVDWAGLCRALLDCPTPPKLLAIRRSEQTAESLPADVRPTYSVPADAPTGVLLDAIHRALPTTGATDSELDVSFAAVLVQLWTAEATGMLTVEAEAVRTTIYIRAGTPIFAEQGTLGDTLGRILVKQGAISEDQFAQAIARMTDSLVNNEQIRLGEVLVEMGLLTGEQVFVALRHQAREKLLKCFQWRRVIAEFEDGDELLESIEAFPCQVPDLLAEGLRRHYSPERIGDILRGVGERFVVLTEEPEAVVRAFHLEASAHRFIRRLDGSRSLDEAWDGTDLDRVVAGQILLALLLSEKLELKQTRPALTSTPQAAPPTHIEPIARIEPRGKRPGLETAALPIRPQQAPVSKPRSHDRLAPLAAEAAFHKATQLRANNALPQALSELERAAELQPDVVEYQMHAALVKMLLADNEPARFNEAQVAGRLARAVLARDRGNAEAHNVLGRVRLAEGNGKSALRHFQQAAKLDPTDRDSARQVRLLHMRGV